MRSPTVTGSAPRMPSRSAVSRVSAPLNQSIQTDGSTTITAPAASRRASPPSAACHAACGGAPVAPGPDQQAQRLLDGGFLGPVAARLQGFRHQRVVDVDVGTHGCLVCTIWAFAHPGGLAGKPESCPGREGCSRARCPLTSCPDSFRASTSVRRIGIPVPASVPQPEKARNRYRHRLFPRRVLREPAPVSVSGCSTVDTEP